MYRDNQCSCGKVCKNAHGLAVHKHHCKADYETLRRVFLAYMESRRRRQKLEEEKRKERLDEIERKT